MKKKYTVKEVAEILGVSHDAVTKWVKSGKVVGNKDGILPGRTSPILIPAEEVARLKKAKQGKA
jgi:excisionase family DNA binding protein